MSAAGPGKVFALSDDDPLDHVVQLDGSRTVADRPVDDIFGGQQHRPFTAGGKDESARNPSGQPEQCRCCKPEFLLPVNEQCRLAAGDEEGPVGGAAVTGAQAPGLATETGGNRRRDDRQSWRIKRSFGHVCLET